MAPKNTINLQEAIELFDRLADREDIAFGYGRDGCYARAHIMCRQMISEGLSPGKAWAFEGSSPLSVEQPNGASLQWWFHVTAALDVDTGEGIQKLVFDPALFDGPVPLEEWGRIMHAESEKLEIADFGTSPTGYSGDYNPHEVTGDKTDKIASKRMKEYLGYQNNEPRVLFASQHRQQVIQQMSGQQGAMDSPGQLTETFRQSQRIPALQGKTWMSAALYQQSKIEQRTDTFAGTVVNSSISPIQDTFDKAVRPVERISPMCALPASPPNLLKRIGRFFEARF